MKTFYTSQNGFVECEEWSPHCWINVEGPDHDDMKYLGEELGVPEDFLVSSTDPNERPRIDREGDWRFIILRIPFRTVGQVSPYDTIPIGIITNNEILLTICAHKTEMISDFITHTRRREIQVDSESDFVLRLMYSSAYWYLKYLEVINRYMIIDEKSLASSIKNEDMFSMLGIQRTLVYFNTSIQANEILVDRLQSVYGEEFDSELSEDVKIELRQADMTAKIYDDIMGNTLDSFASVISNNVNSIMKKMAALSIVLMVPTMIASFYGMNVAVAFQNEPYMFEVIIIGSLVLSIALYVFLRKIRWF